jgi:malonyl-CoA O-methyltransferase
MPHILATPPYKNVSYLSKVKQDFNKAAPHYDHYAKVQARIAKRVYPKLAHFANTGTIIDVGAGTGSLITLAKHDNRQWIALDIALEMCKLTQPMAVSICGQAEAIPLEDQSVMGYVSNATLQWSSNLADALAEMERILAPKGKFILTCFGPNSLRELRQCFTDLGLKPPLHTLPSYQAFAPHLTLPHQVSHFRLCDYYPSLRHLLVSIKQTGARYKGAQQPLPKQWLQRAEATYKENYASQGLLPLTWDVMMIEGYKP